jgi:nucleotide-binding universal stress UspA family protein
MASAPKLVLSLKLKNILFATDFSPCSEAALAYARGIAGRFNSTVHVVHVLPQEGHSEVHPNHGAVDNTRRVAEERMAKFLLQNPLKGISHEIIVERGPLWHVLQDIIREAAIDLIVLGTHGRRGLKKLMLGSVAEEIFRRAECPVLTVGPHVPAPAGGEGRLQQILYATDFTIGSLHALPYALSLAKEHRATLALLHVLPDTPEIPEPDLEQITEGVRQRLRQLLTPGTGLWCQSEPVVLFGSAADGILRVAEEDNIDLIVMGARRPAVSLASAHLPWATAHKVVCQAHCPVLTVRT